MVSFSFLDCLQGLVLISTHVDLSNIDITVAHSHHAEILFLGSLTAGSELSNSSFRRGLGGLAARVGVNFGIEDKNVDIIAGSEDVIQSAVTDIVSPAVTTKDPLGTFNEELFVVVDGFEFVVTALFSLEQSFELFSAFTAAFANFSVSIQSSIAAFRSALTESLTASIS